MARVYNDTTKLFRRINDEIPDTIRKTNVGTINVFFYKRKVIQNRAWELDPLPTQFPNMEIIIM